jgi:hypothetical protein
VRDYPIPLDELIQVAATQDSLAQRQIDVVALIRKVGSALSPNERATGIAYKSLQGGDTKTANGRSAQPAVRSTSRPANKPSVVAYEIQLSVRLAADGEASVTPEAAVARAKSLLTRLESAFPGDHVDVAQLPANAAVNAVMEGGVGDTETARAKADAMIAKYVIRKGA